MLPLQPTRRGFLCRTAVIGGSALLGDCAGRLAMAQTAAKLHVACNHYPWMMFYRRQGRDFDQALDAGLAEVARSGMDGFEPIVGSPAQLDRLVPLLKKHRLEMRSLYVGSVLHDPPQAETSIRNILAIGEKAKAAGAEIVVTNPQPLGPGQPGGKDDAQLKVQAAALDRLGQSLKDIGLTLSYHNHAVELQNAAREFHHMMLGTDPGRVTLCLDAHWIYRGSGNSAVALFDVIKLYGARVSELHLRQSAKNVWTEWFGEGDIDYAAVAQCLSRLGVRPHLVVEQAPEQGTPNTMDAVESHRRSRSTVERLFAQ